MIKIKDTFYTSPLKGHGKGRINYVRIMNRLDYSMVYQAKDLAEVKQYIRDSDYTGDENNLYVVINNDI